ncbi:hypothetical protein SAMN03159453_04222 [Pseudomonas sp. NFIX28]|nr:hypothetical protein SAMN03159453_04222 [Pseudomonas sp. NFIX28]
MAILDTSADRDENELFAVEIIKPITNADIMPTIAADTVMALRDSLLR